MDNEEINQEVKDEVKTESTVDVKESNKSRTTTGLLICIIILFIALLGTVLFFTLNKTKTNNVLNDENNLTTSEKSIAKLDDAKDLVYDAEYTYGDLKGKSYISETMEQRYSLDDIIVPYININSPDAINANKEIKNLYNELAEYFKNELEDAQTWYNISSYKTYTNGNILSILIIVESGGTFDESYTYYTYNFDLDTLKKLSYSDVYQKLGLTSSNIDSKVKNGIMNCEKLSQPSEIYLFEGNNLNTYIDRSVNNYKKSVANNSIGYFIDLNGKLNVIVKIEAPIGAEEFNTIITVK